MASCKSHYILTCAASTLLLAAVCAMADSAEEKQKCMDDLEGLATCLPYLGGDAKAPTPDCCSGFKEAIKSVNKCVCLVVKDRNDPDLDLKLNISLVLRLPEACKAPENFSQCPAILHLDPLSPEAQAFYQINRTMMTGGATGSPTFSPPASDERSPLRGINHTAEKNEACCSRKTLSAPEILVAGLLFWLSLST